mmetsp:Transcript_52480/g.113639  ORF Transcript_52480/g.113639 Transcript_52480/m.113639 type:complete len:215 (-) Transcript_52480:2804-3448(-)
MLLDQSKTFLQEGLYPMRHCAAGINAASRGCVHRRSHLTHLYRVARLPIAPQVAGLPITPRDLPLRTRHLHHLGKALGLDDLPLLFDTSTFLLKLSTLSFHLLALFVSLLGVGLLLPMTLLFPLLGLLLNLSLPLLFPLLGLLLPLLGFLLNLPLTLLLPLLCLRLLLASLLLQAKLLRLALELQAMHLSLVLRFEPQPQIFGLRERSRLLLGF